MSEPAPQPPARRPARLWLWVLVAVVVIGVLALPLFLAYGGDDDDDGGSAAPTVPAVTNPTDTSPQPAPVQSSTGSQTTRGAGTLTALDRDLYPLLQRDLARFDRQQVTARSVRVLSVLGAEVFWAGASPARRILVHVRTKGLAPPHLRGKKRVDFFGQMSPNSKNAAARYGVRARADLALLARQGFHVEVSIADMKLR